jgi:hypothetical protein
MGKGTPFGFYQGNRSEYLAIPALSKLGFTIPVPRQEDRFGIDFIVHLARLEGNTVIPIGRSFGIQIKANNKPLIFNGQEERDCLYESTIPFFLGVVSRRDLTLTIYSTLARLCFFWMKGPNKPFKIIPKRTGDGLVAPKYKEGHVWTGKPILEIDIGEKPTAKGRLEEIQNLQATMKDWIKLENDILSLKEQKVPIVWRPLSYETNKPFSKKMKSECIRYANPTTLPDICTATQKTIMSLAFYLEDCLNPKRVTLSKDLRELIEKQHEDIKNVMQRNKDIRGKASKSHRR